MVTKATATLPGSTVFTIPKKHSIKNDRQSDEKKFYESHIKLQLL